MKHHDEKRIGVDIVCGDIHFALLFRSIHLVLLFLLAPFFLRDNVAKNIEYRICNCPRKEVKH